MHFKLILRSSTAKKYEVFFYSTQKRKRKFIWNSVFSHFCFPLSLFFLLLFKYSGLHFPPTIPPNPSHPHLPPLILPPAWFCPCVLYTCFLTTLPPFPPLSFSPFPSGYCQFVLYFNVSGCILLACLFCCLGSTYR